MAFERDPKFYGELKQANSDILKLIENCNKKSPYFDYSNTFQDYIEQITELRRKFPKEEARQTDNDVTLTNDVTFEPKSDFADQSLQPAAPTGDVESACEAENEEPPQPNVDIFCESGAKCEARCKLWEVNKPGARSTNPHLLLGCGMLYVKELKSNKLHLIMRQDPDLRKVVFNHVITPATPLKQLTKSIQLLVPNEDGKTGIYVAKFKDDNVAQEVFRVLNSVRENQ